MLYALFLVGAELPSSALSTASSNYVYGPRMLPTPTNDGLILYSNKDEFASFLSQYCINLGPN